MKVESVFSCHASRCRHTLQTAVLVEEKKNNNGQEMKTVELKYKTRN